MFRKRDVLKFLGNMCGGDRSYPGVQLAAWKVTEVRLHHRYFSVNFLKLATNPILPVGQL